MKKSRRNHKGALPTGIGEVDHQTVEDPRSPPGDSENSAAKAGQTSPVEPASERFPALEEHELTLTFFALEAREVAVAGSFNDWHPDATPLRNLGDGEWVVRLMLRSGQYEYRFVVDGQWSDDPRAPQRVVNPYGGLNSILTVPLPSSDTPGKVLSDSQVND